MSGILSDQYAVMIIGANSDHTVDAVDTALQAEDDIVYLPANNGVEIEPQAENFQADRLRPGQSGVPSTLVERNCTFSVPFPLLGGVGAANRPEYADILLAAGFKETNPDASSTLFTLQSLNDNYLSAHYYHRNLNNSNWRLRHFYGGLCGLSIEDVVGEEAVATAAGLGLGYPKFTAERAYFDDDGKPALDKDGTDISTYAGAAAAASGERLVCKGATVEYNSSAVPLLNSSLDLAWRVEGVDTQNADPVGTLITRDRNGVAPANGQVEFAFSDLGDAHDDIEAAIAANEVADFVKVYESANRKLTITKRLQFLGPLTYGTAAGSKTGIAQYILVGNSSSHPFSDNELTLLYEDA